MTQPEPITLKDEIAASVVTRIRPSRGWVSFKLDELWEYHELLYLLAWRDIKMRYIQTVLGAAWAILQPFMTMVVFSLFFGRLAKIPSVGVPRPVFSLTALGPQGFPVRLPVYGRGQAPCAVLPKDTRRFLAK